MTLEQAQMIVELGKVLPQSGDSFELLWAKHEVKSHKSLLARCAFAEDPRKCRALVQARYRRAFAIVLADLLGQE